MKNGDRVVHVGHGIGTVIEVREQTDNSALDYILSERGTECRRLLPPELLVGAFYSANRYPYRVQFDSGYCDVYTEREVTLLN